MYAITVKQPWAEAIARHGKTVENRTRRPPAHLIGQRVAIHVGNARDAWDFFPRDVPPHLDSLLAWMQREHGAAWWACRPPQSGMIIATARLVGTVRAHQDHNGDDCVCMGMIAAAPDAVNGEPTDADRDLVSAACRSPWFTGPVGWVLADVRPLAVPVDGGYTSRFEGCHSDCFSEGCPMCDGRSWVHRRIPIRGQLYPFALSPEVEAAVLRRERDHA